MRDKLLSGMVQYDVMMRHQGFACVSAASNDVIQPLRRYVYAAAWPIIICRYPELQQTAILRRVSDFGNFRF